jgi:hypothetical protein
MNKMGSSADCPYDSSLPEPAKQWMDVYEANMKARISDNLELKPVYDQLDELADRLQLQKYSVQAFRDLHFLEYPASSVGGLPISNDLFLYVIRIGAYTIDELREKIDNREISSPILNSIISSLKR